MRCAESQLDGRACRRNAAAAVAAGDVVVFLCGDCTVRALARVRGLVVRRWLVERSARRPA